MEWLKSKSIDELKKYGNLAELKKKIQLILGNNIKISSNSWENFFDGIQNMKNVAKLFNEQTEVKEKNAFFKGESEEVIFYLVELDGKIRLDKLGVNMMHYSKKEFASKWRNNIAKKIHPDICNHPKAGEAMNELNDIYKEMIR